MKPLAIVIMGVSGSGKSTIGSLLADELGGRFYDGDDFHPPENVAKMAAGDPLDDQDREGWLASLAKLIRDASDTTVIACSALKARYRDVLSGAEFVFLDGSHELIQARLNSREDHYMPPSLLDSQFEALEVPAEALRLDISKSPEELVHFLAEYFQQPRAEGKA